MGMPPEVIIQFYKSVDKLKTVTRLSSTCRKFHHVWKSNIKTILDVVLPRAIECLEEAQGLCDAQGQGRSASEGTDANNHALHCAKQYFINAQIAKDIFTCYQDDARRAAGQQYRGKDFKEDERRDIIRAYYRASTIVISKPLKGTPRQICASLNLLEFMQVVWVTQFTTAVMNGFVKVKAHPDIKQKIEGLGMGTNIDWEYKYHTLEELRTALIMFSDGTILSATFDEVLHRDPPLTEYTGAHVPLAEVTPDLNRHIFEWVMKL